MIKTAGEALSTVVSITDKVKETDSGKEAMQELGKAALTLSKVVNVVLTPIAAVNFSYDKAREYFANQFETDMANEMAGLDQEDLIDPKPSVVAPALQGLAFAHEEEHLKEMYLSLIASSMNKSRSSLAHPSFSEIIKQLTPDEAVVFREFSRPTYFEICSLSIKTSGRVVTRRYHDVIPLSKDGNWLRSKQTSPIIRNLIRLGLFEVDYGAEVASESAYVWLEGHPDYIDCVQSYGKDRLHIDKGACVLTGFGEQFKSAVLPRVDAEGEGEKEKT
ncbi:MAG: DUF4393 domain-containing protein [Pseudomonadota bacterium]